MQLDKLTDLAASAPEPSRFYSALTETLRELTEARAIAVWSVVGQSFRLEASQGLHELELGQDQALQALHERSLGEVCQSDTGWYEQQTADMVFNFYACRSDESVFLVIELAYHPKNASTSPQRLLSAVEEIVRDYHKSTRLRDYEYRLTTWHELAPIIERIHAASTLDKLAFEIVNEVRRYLSCDRVVLLRAVNFHSKVVNKFAAHGKCETLAVSAVATIDPRSEQLRSLEHLAESVLQVESSWVYPSAREQPPQRVTILNEYLDHSGCQQLSIHGLVAQQSHEPPDVTLAGIDNHRPVRPDVIGGLVIESFHPSTDAPYQEARLQSLLPHLHIAFSRAVYLDQLPLMKLSYRLQRWNTTVKQRGLRWLLIVATLAALMLITTLIPYKLEIVAEGVFEPAEWKHIYAPLSGEIIEVLAQHQSEVQAGQPLLRMRNRELELKKQELVTQRNVSLEKLRGIEAARLGRRSPSQTSNAPTAMELSASERELEELVASLDKQLIILDQILESLEIKSPARGQVVSWNTASSLERRPVQQGQRLLSLASGQGMSRLQLFVADSDIQHVIRAQDQALEDKKRGGARVVFSVATDPGIKHIAHVQRIGTIVESSSSDAARVRIEAQVYPSDLPDPSVPSEKLSATRPGATVLARIDCGRSNLAYVWLRRLWERWLLWKG